jgi:hypothetical protein
MYVAQSNQSMGPWTLRHSRHDSLAQPIFAAARDQVIDARLNETTLFECCVRERSEDGPSRSRESGGGFSRFRGRMRFQSKITCGRTGKAPVILRSAHRSPAGLAPATRRMEIPLLCLVELSGRSGDRHGSRVLFAIAAFAPTA